MRRRPGALVPLEQEICASAAALRRRGVGEFHGYELAKQIAHDGDRRLLIAYGTLYRALGRLERMGLLQSRREDPAVPVRENRPPRRLYTLTAAGEAAARDVKRAARTRPARRGARRVARA